MVSKKKVLPSEDKELASQNYTLPAQQKVLTNQKSPKANQQKVLDNKNNLFHLKYLLGRLINRGFKVNRHTIDISKLLWHDI